MVYLPSILWQNHLNVVPYAIHGSHGRFTNANKAPYTIRQIHQNYLTFAFFDPPKNISRKMANSMIPWEDLGSICRENAALDSKIQTWVPVLYRLVTWDHLHKCGINWGYCSRYYGPNKMQTQADWDCLAIVLHPYHLKQQTTHP